MAGWRLLAAGLLAFGFAAPIRAQSAKLDPAAVEFKLPDQINWVENAAAGNASANLYGDPNKPGLYIQLVKWHAGHMSRPHFHPNDRFITVVSGTWWVGSGPKYSPETTTPLPAGSFVVHHARQVHYDGAKEGDAVLEIVGMGPATATPAEVK